MPLPDHVTARIKRSIEDLFSAELGAGAGALQDAMRPMLRRAFERGMSLGVTLSASASGQGIEALKTGLIEDLGIAAPTPPATPRPANRTRVARATKSGKQRAAPGAVGQAIELVLADQPGSRIIEIQDLAVRLDPTISRSSVTNELRRYLGKRYRQEGVRWYRIGDTEKGSGLAPPTVVPDPLVGGPEAATAVSGPPASRAA
jgi:hypothetical protein